MDAGRLMKIECFQETQDDVPGVRVNCVFLNFVTNAYVAGTGWISDSNNMVDLVATIGENLGIEVE